MVGVGIRIGICVGVGIGIGVGSGSISQHLASGGIWAGSIWQHLGSSVASGRIWRHRRAPSTIWEHLEASGSNWQHLGWQHLAPSGTIWAPRQSDPSPGARKSRICIHFYETVNESWFLVPEMMIIDEEVLTYGKNRKKKWWL